MTRRHLTTDPACRRHRYPSTWLGRMRYDRNRGRSCGTCMQRRVQLLHVDDRLAYLGRAR